LLACQEQYGNWKTNREKDHLMKYENAIVTFDEDVATLLCNGCGITIAEGTKHEDREHYCTMCMSGNCKTKFKKGN